MVFFFTAYNRKSNPSFKRSSFQSFSCPSIMTEPSYLVKTMRYTFEWWHKTQLNIQTDIKHVRSEQFHPSSPKFAYLVGFMPFWRMGSDVVGPLKLKSYAAILKYWKQDTTYSSRPKTLMLCKWRKKLMSNSFKPTLFVVMLSYIHENW